MGGELLSGDLLFVFAHFSHMPARRETFPRRFFNLSCSLEETDASEHLPEFLEAPFGTKPLCLFVIWTRPAQKHFVLCWGTKLNAMNISPQPLTSVGRCQALGGAGRYRPYVVWASLQVSMWYGRRFYVGSPHHIGAGICSFYHVGPASAVFYTCHPQQDDCFFVFVYLGPGIFR